MNPPNRSIRGLSVLPEARFACQNSGQCCQGYQVGPVGDAVAQRVDAHRFVGNAALIGESGFERREIDGELVRVLRRHQGRCVFLGEGVCVIHAELGAAAKPALCRRYPFNVAVDPHGVAHISLNMECGGYARGRRGPLLIESLGDQLHSLLAVAPLQVADECVITPSRTAHYDLIFENLEGPWLEDLDAEVPLAVVLNTLCGRLWSGGLVVPNTRSVGQRGGPNTLPNRLKAAHPNDLRWPLGALRALSATVAEHARRVADEEQTRDPVDADLHRTLATAAHRASTAPHIEPPPQVEALLREQLQHAIFGKALHRAPSLAAGLGYEIFKLWLVAQMADSVPTAVAAQRVVNRCLRLSGVVDQRAALAIAQAFASGD